ncbi:MAG: DNA mismatch repair endonuclease MutL [Bacteroidota bacterium]
MPDIIRLLPDAIANQIAAGEVVQRPASVVKELMENAVDAKATDIKVIIKDAGKSLIQIIDNGIGMTETDARMSLERHATSKITKAEDLFSLKTMGFRGEALASIAAVSQMELRTKSVDGELATTICVEGSEIKSQEPTTGEQGTSISVKNLFYNIPARRNFLKSNSVENKHIIDDFQRVALANRDISFSLFIDNNEVLSLPDGKLSQRIVNIFGKQYREQLVACKEETPHLQIEGYIGKPESAKKSRGEQFFFVNNRFIRSNYLNHAVLGAFEGLLPEGSYPFYILFITIDPKHIDVNVHPTKTEIKFDDERTVYGIIKSTVKQSLGLHNVVPSIDFSVDVNFKSATEKVGQATTKAERDYSQFKRTPLEDSNIKHWENIYDDALTASKLNYEDLSDEEKGESITIESSANQMELKDLQSNQEPVSLEKSNVFQLHNKYIVTQVKSGMMFINQQGAHERILFEKYLDNIQHQTGMSQQSLFPQSVTLNPSDFSLVMEMEQEIKSLGFVFEVFGKNDIVINGIPTDVISGDEKSIFEGLIEQFKQNKSELSIPLRENLARSMAKRSAIKQGQTLKAEEMNFMIDKLFACSNPNYDPGGNSIFYILDTNRIDSFFN